MKVTLRQRNQGGKTSLYLDYYYRGKRRTEYLKLYLEPNPKTQATRELNKKTLQLAETIRAKRQIEIQNETFGFGDHEKRKASFISYLKLLARKRKESVGNFGNWESMIRHMQAYSEGDVTFNQVDARFVQGFKDYLERKNIGRGGAPLSPNTQFSYFNKLKAALKQAGKDGIITKNPAANVKGFDEAETVREFLTQEELQACASAHCEIPLLKSAFLFSCLTGLRFSDIQKLQWSEVQHSADMGYYLRFRQKKTKGAETQPISDEAYGLLGMRKRNEDAVFSGLPQGSWPNQKLREWISRAGITKKITFHCGRHTYATQLLINGVDIYTVSKLLGHRDIKTTQIYARVIDLRKKEAASKVRINL